MADNERLLESRLKSMESSCERGASSESSAHSDIALIMALRAVEPPAREVDAARLRVRARVFDVILADDDRVEGARAPRHPQSPRSGDGASAIARAGKRRLLVAVAAMFLLAFLGSWAVSSAASIATPASPLYGLKRADEWLALQSAWSDQRRGQVYATIAWHRLAEAQFESQRHNDSAAQRLTQEYDVTMQRLIQLDADMEARHENTTVVAQGIARNLDRAYTIAQAASQSGEATLAQTLTATTTAERAAIKQANITVPTVGGHIPAGQPTGTTTPSHGRTPTPSTDVSQTPTEGQETGTPPSGNGSGAGGGNGNGGNGSNGDRGR